MKARRPSRGRPNTILIKLEFVEPSHWRAHPPLLRLSHSGGLPSHVYKCAYVNVCSPQCVCGNKEQEERGGGDIGDWYNGKRKGWGWEEGGGGAGLENIGASSTVERLSPPVLPPHRQHSRMITEARSQRLWLKVAKNGAEASTRLSPLSTSSPVGTLQRPWNQERLVLE